LSSYGKQKVVLDFTGLNIINKEKLVEADMKNETYPYSLISQI